MSSIRVRYVLMGLGASLVLFLLLSFQASWWWYWNWLAATSVVAFGMYGFDKMQAKRDAGTHSQYGAAYDGADWRFCGGAVGPDRIQS